MKNRGQIIFGIVLVLLGIFSLLGVIFRIDLGILCWPTVLILLGLLLLFRPQLERSGSRVLLLADARQTGVWQVTDETYWVGVGDVKFDFAQAEVPLGETRIRVNGFVGSVKVTAPPSMALSVSGEGFVVDSNVFGVKEDNFLSGMSAQTPGYETAERKVRLETLFFVNDLKVKQEPPAAV